MHLIIIIIITEVCGNDKHMLKQKTIKIPMYWKYQNLKYPFLTISENLLDIPIKIGSNFQYV